MFTGKDLRDVDALVLAGGINRIRLYDGYVPGASSSDWSIFAAPPSCSAPQPISLCSLRKPSRTFFTPARIERRRRTGEIFWSLVPESVFTGPFAQATKGFNRFRDIAICHGNLYLLRPEPLLASGLRSRLNDLYRSRKSTVRAGLVLGPWVGLSYLIGVRLLRLLSLGEMTDLVSKRLGLKLAPIPLAHPEVCLDVDEPQDYVLTRKILEQ